MCVIYYILVLSSKQASSRITLEKNMNKNQTLFVVSDVRLSWYWL
jgi:hypothetical protein